MYRPIHFEIPSADPAKAISFYEKLFGWKFTKWEGPMEYWIISTGYGAPGINGGMMARFHPQQPCVNTIDVPDLDACIQSVLSAGGELALPKQAVKGVGWLAYCKDLDGHIFGIMQADAAAA